MFCIFKQNLPNDYGEGVPIPHFEVRGGGAGGLQKIIREGVPPPTHPMQTYGSILHVEVPSTFILLYTISNLPPWNEVD